MNINTELIFRAICAFYDGEYANFTLYSLRNAVKEDALKAAIKLLKSTNEIEDYTINGCARRFKINNPLDCPDFIFDERFNFQMRIYLLDRGKVNQSIGNFVAKSIYETKLQLLGTSSEEIIKNTKLIKKQIEVPNELLIEKTNDGYKIKIKPIPKEIRDQTYECKYCGDTNKEHFGNLHTICKNCYNALDRNRKSYAERLYKSSKQNARMHKYDHNLSLEYIQQLLEDQHYRCKYSGVQFTNNKKDKYTYPTIDRIDSSKGYIEGNVCICTGLVNTMKNNLSVDEFKNIVTKIYNNKNSF